MTTVAATRKARRCGKCGQLGDRSRRTRDGRLRWYCSAHAPGRPRKEEKACAFCGGKFRPSRRVQLYCSRRCGGLAGRVKSRQAPPGAPLCRRCGESAANRPRGLCWSCYHTPGVREHYPSTSKFARRGLATDPGERNPVDLPGRVPEPPDVPPDWPDPKAQAPEPVWGDFERRLLGQRLAVLAKGGPGR